MNSWAELWNASQTRAGFGELRGLSGERSTEPEGVGSID